MELSVPGENPQQDTISFAEMSGGIVVVRVLGRGSFSNSVELKTLADRLADQHGPGKYHFIVDLDQCSTMDSTFMGTLASIGLRQKRDGLDSLIVVNANEQSSRLLQTLGLAHFISIRSSHPAAQVMGAGFQQADTRDVSRQDRIAHMIEAHENLVDIDSQNATRFESVLKYLRESLEREKND